MPVLWHDLTLLSHRRTQPIKKTDSNFLSRFGFNSAILLLISCPLQRLFPFLIYKASLIILSFNAATIFDYITEFLYSTVGTVFLSLRFSTIAATTILISYKINSGMLTTVIVNISGVGVTIAAMIKIITMA